METEIDKMFAKISRGVIPLSAEDELIGYLKEWGEIMLNRQMLNTCVQSVKLHTKMRGRLEELCY